MDPSGYLGDPTTLIKEYSNREVIVRVVGGKLRPTCFLDLVADLAGVITGMIK